MSELKDIPKNHQIFYLNEDLTEWCFISNWDFDRNQRGIIDAITAIEYGYEIKDNEG